MGTKKHHLLVIVALSLVGIAIAPTARAQMQNARPFVMILLDTSGSMEWRAASFDDGGERLPTCSGGPLDQRSRWIITQEVLTGTFESYSCEYEEREGDQAGYYIPHVRANYHRQLADGIIDLYSDDVEFGLMTMDSMPSARIDGVGMWSYPSGDDPLAERHRTKVIEGQDTQGILWTRLNQPECQYFWNVGARRPYRVDAMGGGVEDFAGRMIPHYGASGGPSYRARNQAVQREIMRTRPYWSSPIAALLADARYYYTETPELLAPAGPGAIGDCYFNCRDRHVILITDGIPNADGRPECRFARDGEPPAEGVCPYPEAWEEAFALYSEGVNVHVVGFSAVDTEANVLDADGEVVDVVDELWRIGVWGWGGLATGCPTTDAGDRQCVLYADNAAELRAALSSILSTVVEDASSRTRSATVNTVITDVVGQYQFFSSMEIPGDEMSDMPWEGNLERVTYRCVEDEDGEWDIRRDEQVYNYGDEGLDALLITPNDFNTRHIYTIDAEEEDIPPGDGDSPVAMTALHKIHNPLRQLDVANDGRRLEILNWIHGATGTEREERRLGAIYHTTPVIVGPPTLELPLASYNVGPHRNSQNKIKNIGFRQLYAKRRQIMYVATMDGILHAFDVSAAEPGADRNPELWGFIPPMLLPSLDDQLSGQSYLLDGQIAVRDLRLWKEAGGDSIDVWATVLVMGLRQGGGHRGYFALDVTAPEMTNTEANAGAAAGGGSLGEAADPPYGQPRLLWQITNDTPTDPVGGVETLQSYAGLGLTYSRPTFGTVMVTEGMRTGETGVVILPGGVRPAGEPLAVGCGLYIVRASDGRLIRWLTPNVDDIECQVDGDGEPECDYDPAVHDCQIVGTPLALGSLPGDMTTRVYVGDSQGRLYRADLSSENPADWTLDPFFDLFDDPEEGVATDRQPIFEAPAAAIDHRGLVTLVFGSGDPDDLQNRPINRLASITEMYDNETSLALAERGGSTDQGETCHLSWSDVYRRDDWGGQEFVMPRACAGPDLTVFPWANWLVELDPDSTPDDANLNGPVDIGPRAPFVVGERMLGAPVIFDSVAYLTTFVPSSDLVDCCSPGHGRILGIHYIGDTNPDTLSDTDDVFRSRENREASVEIHEMGDNEFAFGVSVVRRPSCMEIRGDEIPDFAMARPAEYQLVVHNNADPDAHGPDAAGAPEEPETGYEQIGLAAPPLQAYPESWLSIFFNGP